MNVQVAQQIGEKLGEITETEMKFMASSVVILNAETHSGLHIHIQM